MDIVITLAGKSKRFFDEKYNKVKYLLPIGKSTVIEQVLNLFDDSDNFHLIISKKQFKDNSSLNKYLRGLKKNIFLYTINDHDYGPVFSVLEAKIKNIKNKFILCYNDLLVDWDYKKFKRLCFGYDGGIVSFSGFQPSFYTGTLYCYLKIKNNEIIKLREKKSFTKNPASEIASTGIYYFNNFDEFTHYSEQLFKNKKNYINNELYVSQVYLPMLKDEKKILDYRVKNFISLGTPRDYKLFLSWKEYFEKNE